MTMSQSTVDTRSWPDAPPKRVASSSNTSPVDTRVQSLDEGVTVIATSAGSYREAFREYSSEFFGTMILVIFGNGVNCQVSTSANSGDWLSVSATWAVGIAIGVWVAVNGHINPAITLAMATWRGFPWRKVPGYILSQFLGALVGAAIVYATFFHAIDVVEGGRGVRTLATAGNFGTYAADYMTNVSCFFSEFLATTIFLFGIATIQDRKNGLPAGGQPFALFLLFMGIAAGLGYQTSFSLNPARDFGPRILTAMVGYGSDVFNYRNQYWLWCPILGPIFGAQIGILAYDLFLNTNTDTLIFKKL
ncbi:aquaporin [Fistulina hepatica ATCC 64428]|uniref:Aquaporin n=1 Tax=Fistulina hepatica ATCC 64428 TaxID=1128425 RepID=A0A0D7A2P0_9AGAR|nr:aquaporin [Fistulina hepatica ATCC 64428]